VEGAT
jgi:hypothetical protein